MKKTLSILTCLVLSAGAYTLNVQPGWQLEGALSDINVADFNNTNIISVLAWDKNSKKWMAYIPNKNINLVNYGVENLEKIQKGEGYWINSLGYLTLDVGINNNEVADNGNGEISGGDANNNVDYNHISKYLVDKPVNFDLSDIAGKTFKIITPHGIVNIPFDNNGIGSFSISNATYNLKYENGVIKIDNIDNDWHGVAKKVKEDENGIILSVKGYENNDTYTYEFLDAWSTDFHPVDMGTLSYPKTFYNSWGDKLIIENNGTINGTIFFSWEEKENYTIENGAIIIDGQWSNDTDTSGGNWKYTLQIVNQIDRYDVVKRTYEDVFWEIDNNLKGKTFDDIIDTNISIDGMYLHSDGTVSFDWNNTDENSTFVEINSNEINLTRCYENGKYCENELMELDSDIGKVTNIYKFQDTVIWSESPIFDEPLFRIKSPLNMKTYINLQKERAKRKIF
jgi:hypothetical protein